MTDNLLQKLEKLEEKVMTLVTELESAQKEVNQLRTENVNLKSEKANFSNKLQGLVSLLDTLDLDEPVVHAVEKSTSEGSYAATA